MKRLVLFVVAAVALAGCGLGPGKSASDVSVVITRDFGSTLLGSKTTKKTKGADTVMRLLQRSHHVTTRYGGGFVQSIDGLAGNGGNRVDWFFYINGLEATKGAAAIHVHPGDHIWWDRHDWTATETIPAVVGSFPEPFVHGTGGKRAPVRIECAADAEKACDTITARMAKVGVAVGRAALGSEVGSDTLRIVVGTYGDLSQELAMHQIGQGPKSSGVYARQAAGRLLLLNAKGNVARQLGPGAGLVAATKVQSQLPTWVVTGGSAAGVETAAGAMNAKDLDHHFALAVTASAKIPVPVP